MHAWQIGTEFGIDALERVELPDPRPSPGQLLVRVRAASLNYRDLLVVKGLYNPRLRRPLVPLSDGAGVVAEIGEGVTRFRPGDRVAGCFFPDWTDGEISAAKTRAALGGSAPGMLAELAVLEERGAVPVPEHLTDEAASTLPCAALTAWNALFEHEPVRPGETVLTLGTGGVSLFALQLARLAGARVLITSSSDAKLERARALGAAGGVQYRSEPEWDEAILKLTGGDGVDHVIEVGGAGTLPRSLRAVRVGGTVSLIGVLTGYGECSPLPVLMKQIRLQGIYVGSRAMFERMNRAIAEHRLRPVLDRVFPFAEAREALRYLESGAHFGKVVIRIG